jgi:hypothetical protein
VAVGLSKLTGQDVRYGYAFNLKTGADLVEALRSQKGEGLAFGDIEANLGTGMTHLHFPVFYDYDAKTKTVAVQEWMRGERRVPVDQIQFQTVGNARPSLFYRPDPGMDRFLTPEHQSNWRYLQSRQAAAATPVAAAPIVAPPAETERRPASNLASLGWQVVSPEPEARQPATPAAVEATQPVVARSSSPVSAAPVSAARNGPLIFTGEEAQKRAPLPAPRLVVRSVPPSVDHPQGGWEVEMTSRTRNNALGTPTGFVGTLRLVPDSPQAAGYVPSQPGKDPRVGPKGFSREGESQRWFIPRDADMAGVRAVAGRKIAVGTRGMGWFSEVALPAEGSAIDSDQDAHLWSFQPDQFNRQLLGTQALNYILQYR